MKKKIEQKLKNYSLIKNILRFLNLIISIVAITISIWAISISNRTEKDLKWINDKQDNVIEMLLFKNVDFNNNNNKK
ncbi:MAG: hypothetical protein WDA02_06735 [Saccharofermentanales bacterium]